MAYLMTSAEFIQKAREIEKTDTAYMWGTYGRKITLALINAKVKQYPKRYTAAYIERLKTLIGKAYGWDCVGLIKGILWGWDGVKNVPYSVNGVPDTNVMGFYAKGENKSTDFSKIVPGAAVHLPTHVGIYIGDGLVIEATSAWESRVMITALANIGPVAGYRSRRWDSFYTLPWVDYSGGAEPKPEPEPPVTGDYIEYTVVKGDTPWALAVRFLGAGARYTEIMARNGMEVDANIYVGQILKIPVKGGTAPVDPPKPPAPVTGHLTAWADRNPIKRGTKGKHVEVLQAILYDKGYDIRQVDGNYGAVTENAVKAYQKDQKLTVDGWAGAQVWAALIGG